MHTFKPKPRQSSAGSDVPGCAATESLAEAVDRDGDGAVNVLGGAVLGQPHAAEGLADADDGFQMTNLHRCEISIRWWMVCGAKGQVG